MKFNKSVLGYIVAVVVCILVSIAFFHPDAIQGNQLQQYDSKQGIAIGQETKEYLETTGEKSWWTNSLFGGMPTFQISPTYSTNSWFRWIDTAMRAGLPGPSGYLFSMMFGFLIMAAVIKMRWYYALIGAVAWGLSSYFIIIIGAGHLWKFFTLTYVPPVIGGIIAAYKGRYVMGAAVASLFAMLQIAANHVQMSYYFLFLIIGLVIAYLVVAIIEKKLPQWVKATASLLVAAVLAVGANLPSLYHTYKYSKETIRGQHSLLVSVDNNDKPSSGLNKDYLTQYSYGQAETFSLLIPNIKGGASVKPVHGHLQSLSLADLDEAKKMAEENRLDPATSQYLQYVSQYFGEPEGTNGPVYVGAIICALFLLGCCIVKGPLKWTLLALTVVSILLALGRNAMWLTDFFIDYVPMYKNFRTPESILVIAEFTMPLLAVLALARFFETEKPFETYKKQLLFAFGLPLFFCVLGILFPSIYGSVITDLDYRFSQMIGQQLSAQGHSAEMLSKFSIDNPAINIAVTDLRHSMIESDSWRSLWLILISLIAMWAFAKGFIPRWVAITAVGVLILGDLYTADKRYLNHDSFVQGNFTGNDNLFPLSENDRTILSDTAMNYRVMDIPRFNSPDPSYRHKALGGYHAAKLTHYNDLIDRHLSNFSIGLAEKADFNVLNMLNAKYVITPRGELVVNNAALGNAWLVDSIQWVRNNNDEMMALSFINPAVTAVASDKFKGVLKAPAGPVMPGDTIFETSYAPDRLTYHATVAKPSLAVFSEVWFPWGWQATVDGKTVEIARVDYILRAINIPEGSHTVEMCFDPPSVRNTVTVARVSIILIYLLIAFAFTPRIQRKD